MKNRLIGHRGAGILSPENTISALEGAHKLGLKYVEFDVRLTKDNVAVISHDDSLIRCAHVDQLISESTYEEIKDINVAEHYALEDMNETVPTLLEYLQESKRLGLHCQIELKPNAGGEGLLTRIALEIINGFYSETPEEDLPLITSFIPVCLKQAKEYSSRPYKTGVLVKVEQTKNWKQFAEESQCDYVHLHALYLKKDIAEDVLNSGYKINGFHLNNPMLAEKAIALGCERFTCDIPDIFLKI